MRLSMQGRASEVKVLFGSLTYDLDAVFAVGLDRSIG